MSIRVNDYIEATYTGYDSEVFVAGTVTKIEQGRLYIATPGGEKDSCPVDAVTTHRPAKSKAGNDFVCHYCGLPAVKFDFFNAPICRDCQ